MMLYDIGFAIFSLFYLPTLIFKGKLHRDFLERFGVYDKAKLGAIAAAKDAIWIQAVSVGEVALCRSLIPLIKKAFPGRTIIFSTITRTGNDLAKKLFSDDAVIIYFPLDFSFIVRKVIRLAQPKLYVMIETEIWPNFLKEIKRNDIPSILVNGRISDRSFGKYKLARNFLRKTIESIDALCMQSKLDADRIMELGARTERVQVSGNMKFDIQVKAATQSCEEIRKRLEIKEETDLIVAGSTHSGEEEALLAAYKELILKFPHLKLLMAPRHIERAAEVEKLVKDFGFEPVRLSAGCKGMATGEYKGVRVFILDVIGCLNDFYSIAAVVFVGGSLIKHGGQNPIEPASYEKPVIFGQYMFNFKNVAEAFLAKGGAVSIGDKYALIPAIGDLLADKTKRLEAGRKAREVVDQNRGATERVVKQMGRLLDA